MVLTFLNFRPAEYKRRRTDQIELPPVFVVTKHVQDDFQPIVAEIFGPDVDFQASAQGFFPCP